MSNIKQGTKNLYTVSWITQVLADDPEAAAKTAAYFMQKGNAKVFEVYQPTVTFSATETPLETVDLGYDEES